MEYEYKEILVKGEFSRWDDGGKILQKYFDEGWEYVDGIPQSVSVSGNSWVSLHGDVLFIVRRKKQIKL